MSETAAKIGLGADLFDTDGRPMFGAAPLSLFSDAGLAWTSFPSQEASCPPQAFTDYEALADRRRRRSPDAELEGESGELRVIARNGVGYDAIDTRGAQPSAASCSPTRRSRSETPSPP